MKTEITLIGLERMINTHIESGGVVLDTYREQEVKIVAHALYVKDECGERLHLSDRGTGLSTTIPSSDTLTLEGHEVTYTPNFGYLGDFGYPGKISFLNPAPVDLSRAAAADAAAAYAAAVSRCNRAVDAREVARDVAASADADAKAARAAHEAADAAAYAAYQDMIAAKAAFETATKGATVS